MASRLKEGVKFDDGKLRYDLLPICGIREIIRVLMHGAKKYDDNNWHKVASQPEGKARYYNACKRHIDDWWEGEENDKESGLHHLAHAACCLLFLLWLYFKGEKDG